MLFDNLIDGTYYLHHLNYSCVIYISEKLDLEKGKSDILASLCVSAVSISVCVCACVCMILSVSSSKYFAQLFFFTVIK